MQTFTLFLQKNSPGRLLKFRTIIQKITEKVHTEPVIIEWKEVDFGRHHAFRFCSWCKEEYTLETRGTVHAFLALAVLEWVVQVVEPEVLHQLLTQHPHPQVREKWEEIYPYVQFVFHTTDKQEGSSKKAHKTKLYQDILTYFQEHKELNLEGFARFRLKGYWSELQRAVERGIHEYLQDKEYQEFVELLRYLVSIQETRHTIVHVIPHSTKRFMLYDEKDRLINLDFLESTLGLRNGECRDEDFLVSALVTLAPESIVCHAGLREPSMMETLSQIFEERVTFCQSCMFCLTSGRALDLPKPTQYNT